MWMNRLFVWIFKNFIFMILWVFILSIRWDGRTFFSYLHETFIIDSFVGDLSDQLVDLWQNLLVKMQEFFFPNENQ